MGADGAPTGGPAASSSDDGAPRGRGALQAPRPSSFIRTPLFAAQHSARYQRQELIAQYQDAFDCRLAVVIGPIVQESTTLFEELLYDANPEQDLHLLLVSPGGDGDVAIRMARLAQAHCKEFIVIVPDIAKSAATLLACGAHRIVMGPASDLGPVDPQFPAADGNGFIAAKDMVAAWDRGLDESEKRPDAYPLLAALMSNLDAVSVEQARAAIARTRTQLEQALSANPARGERDVGTLVRNLHERLVEHADRHESLFGPEDATKAGLPVEQADLTSEQWQLIWQLWTKYFELPETYVFEGRYPSQIFSGTVEDDFA